MTLQVRDMRKDDVPACVAILNHIVTLGGSTAREVPCDAREFLAHYLDGSEVANVVLDSGRIVGFQTALEVETGVYSIGTFTDRGNPAKGAGRAIITKSIADVRALGGTAMIAKITDDNTGGLAYYTKVGFVDHAIIENDLTRKNGTVVNRIIKRLVL